MSQERAREENRRLNSWEHQQEAEGWRNLPRRRRSIGTGGEK